MNVDVILRLYMFHECGCHTTSLYVSWLWMSYYVFICFMVVDVILRFYMVKITRQLKN